MVISTDKVPLPECMLSIAMVIPVFLPRSESQNETLTYSPSVGLLLLAQPVTDRVRHVVCHSAMFMDSADLDVHCA